MNKILITGGAGFIGGSLAKKLIEDSDNFVVIVDNLLTGSQDKLPSSEFPNWKFIKCDVNNYNDIAPVMNSHQFDYVFHYAAVVGVKRTLENPVMVLNDIQGIKNILDLAKNTGVRRVLFSSSSEVYGEPVELPQRELTTPLNSRLPYAIVKNVGESFCRSYYQEYGLEYTIFRFFNTYGNTQSRDFVISKFLKAALNNEPITIYGNGDQSRTFCYIDDNVEATINAMHSVDAVNSTYNIGSDRVFTIKQLAETIIQLTDSRSEIVHQAPLEEGDMERRLPDIANMNKLLGRPLTLLEHGLRKVIDSQLFITLNE